MSKELEKFNAIMTTWNRPKAPKKSMSDVLLCFKANLTEEEKYKVEKLFN